MAWGAGEHVAVFGDTGSGKTFLLSRLLMLRPYVLFLQTKSDPTVKREYTKADGWRHIKSLRDTDIYCDRYIYDPPYAQQAAGMRAALTNVWRTGNRCIAVDELFYAEQILGLKKPIERLLTQGRSKKITVVAGAQRPVFVTRFAISQCTHVFCFRLEGRDIKTVMEATTPGMEITRELSLYEFAYFNRKTRAIKRGFADDVQEILSSAKGSRSL